MSSSDKSPVGLALPALLTAAIVAGVAVVTSQSGSVPKTATPAPSHVARGTVVDEAGRAVPRATITVESTKVMADAAGRYTLPLKGPALASASASGHLSRTIALEPGKVKNIGLTSGSARTVSLRFGGDVMLGRRYFTAQEGRSAVLSPRSTAEDHADLFSDVEPLLKDADLSAVNLETPLLSDPETETKGVRRKGLHPSKKVVLASSTKLAKGLAMTGIDVVSLANDHVNDGLQAGLDSTTKALDAAGIAHFGAGATADLAWRPAIVTKRGQSVAFLGCTTIDGRNTPIPNVADATHGGAAECEPQRLVAEVAKVRSRASTVVVMIHGGEEYRRSQTAEARQLAQLAHRAGAHLVVGSHPHVVGGLAGLGNNVFAESLGNLASDQEVWPTFPSVLLRVDVRNGAPVAATTDPLVLDRYRPKPAVGSVAEAIARVTAGYVPGAGRLGGSGSSVAFTSGRAAPPVRVGLKAGEVRRLAPRWWYEQAAAAQPNVRMGTDLLFGTGGFEQMQIGGRSSGSPLWSLGKYGSVTSEAACTPGPQEGSGLMLARTPLSKRSAYASPAHRTAVVPRQRLSLLANIRQASEGSRLQIHWFKAGTGASSGVSSLELPSGSWGQDSCRRVRFDVTVPKGVVAAQVFVVLKPPVGGQKVRRLAVDDVALVDWAPAGRVGRRYDVLEVLRGGALPFVCDEPSTADSVPLLPR